MTRKWVILAIAASSVAGTGVVRSLAGDDSEKSPLARIMVEIDVQTKAIRDVQSSASRFKKGGKKEIAPAAEKLAELGKETKKFTEPAEKQKQPIAKWNEMSDAYVKASEEMIKVAKKGTLLDVRKAFTGLNNTCTNCHGAFRPKTGDDF